MAPPGVSYTPRDFMPTYRFSTMSTRPTPCLPPSLFKVRITSSGERRWPFTATQLPLRKSSVTYSGLSGASSGATLSLNMSLFDGAKASIQGSSRMPASKEMCSRLRSIEYGFRAEACTGIFFFSQ